MNLSPISTEEVRSLLGEARRIVFLDATSPDVWVASEGRIHRLPPYEAPQSEALARDATIVTYTGAAVDGAQLKFRVMRQAHWPIWWGWYGRWHSPQGQASCPAPWWMRRTPS